MKLASQVPILSDYPFATYDDGRVAALAEADAATDPESEYVACAVAYHLIQLQFDVFKDTLAGIETAMRTHPRLELDECKQWIETWPASVRGDGRIDLSDRMNELVAKLGRRRARRLLRSSIVPRVERLRSQAQAKLDRLESARTETAAAQLHPESLVAEGQRLGLTLPELGQPDPGGRSSRPRRPTIPEAVRHAVWRRDEGRCVECGTKENLEFDHIIPFSASGANTERNLQLLCESCNRRKGARI